MKSFSSSCDNNNSMNSKLSSMHKISSHNRGAKSSSKPPKIRIIHVIAPEIIKTDAENFRGLVQRLTGRRDDDDNEGNKESSNNKMMNVIESKEQAKKMSSHFDMISMMKEDLDYNDEHRVIGMEDFVEFPAASVFPIKHSQLNTVSHLRFDFCATNDLCDI